MTERKRKSGSKPEEDTAEHTSPGDNPVNETPKDISAGDASARDMTERHLDSSDPDEKEQELLDEGIDLSFPASDPPSSIGGITRIEKPATGERARR